MSHRYTVPKDPEEYAEYLSISSEYYTDHLTDDEAVIRYVEYLNWMDGREWLRFEDSVPRVWSDPSHFEPRVTYKTCEDTDNLVDDLYTPRIEIFGADRRVEVGLGGEWLSLATMGLEDYLTWSKNAMTMFEVAGREVAGLVEPGELDYCTVPKKLLPFFTKWGEKK